MGTDGADAAVPRLPPLARKWLKVVYFLGIGALVLEIAVRVTTLVQLRQQLGKFPDVEERYEHAATKMKRLTVRALVEGPEHFPAPVFAENSDDVSWTSFGELGPEHFPRAPTGKPAPGVVRIAFVGGSTTFDQYPEAVGKLFDEKLGAGVVEVVNLGWSVSSTATTMVILRRMLPRVQPQVVVIYQGFNDIVYYRSRSRALYGMSTGRGDTDGSMLGLPPRSRGAFTLVKEWLWPSAVDDPLMEASVLAEPISNYWVMSRQAWQQGRDFYVSTFATPSLGQLSPEERDFYDTTIRMLWPVLGSAERYDQDIRSLNDQIRKFAAQSKTPLIDVEKAVTGGRSTFRDNCHTTEAGRASHARAVFEALLPRVVELRDGGRGEPPALPRVSPVEVSRDLPKPAADGSCLRGPCPESACLVPAMATRYGYEGEPVDRIYARLEGALGWGNRVWFDDDGPAVSVEVSAFCVDRTEVSAREHGRCVAAGTCPPVDVAGTSASTPAVIPTAVDAEHLCAFRGGRLPTDAEWSAAARGPQGLVLPWSGEWTGKEANYCGRECAHGNSTDPDDGFPEAAPIGKLGSKSPFGAVDMAGNLWEWVADCFVHKLRDHSRDTRDPIAPETPDCRRYMRGGSFQSYAGLLERRVAQGFFDIDVPGRGVRCVYDFGTRHREVGAQPARR